MTAHLTSQHSAIKMLNQRVRALLSLAVKMQRGEMPVDHALLRQLSALALKLPTATGPAFQKDFMSEYNDTLLLIYLASVTQGTNRISELVDKFNLAFDKHARRRAFM